MKKRTRVAKTLALGALRDWHSMVKSLRAMHRQGDESSTLRVRQGSVFRKYLRGRFETSKASEDSTYYVRLGGDRLCDSEGGTDRGVTFAES